MSRAAAVTGLGLVTPVGRDLDAFWTALEGGKSSARLIRSFDASPLPVRIACEIDDFDAKAELGAKDARRMDRFAQLAVVAAARAWDDAGAPAVPSDRVAVVAGTGSGGILTSEEQAARFVELGPTRMNPLLVPMTMANAAAAHIAVRFGWTGPTLTVSTACATGAHSVGEGLRMIRDGSADVVIAGGAEATISPFVIAAFANLQALSHRNDDPAAACRPFDAKRDGFVMAEGAAFLVLEPEERARARGARIYARLAGYGRNTDAHHMVLPDPSGARAKRCMELALDDAGAAADDVVHINAHGTSTFHNDLTESRAIAELFGPGAVPVTSTKGVLGHMIGAAGAVEAAASALTVHHGSAPPTANVETVDADCLVDVITDKPLALGAGPVISNSFAFGGHNVSLVFLPEPEHHG